MSEDTMQKVDGPAKFMNDLITGLRQQLNEVIEENAKLQKERIGLARIVVAHSHCIREDVIGTLIYYGVGSNNQERVDLAQIYEHIGQPK